MAEGDDSKSTVNTGKEYTVYLLPRVLIVGEGASFDYAIKLSEKFANDKEICVTQYDVSDFPSGKERDNLKILGRLDVTNENNWDRLKRFGPFEAIIFNNPHAGYQFHKGLVLGVTKGHTVSELFYDSIPGDSLADFSSGHKVDIPKKELFSEVMETLPVSGKKRIIYLVEKTTMGLNEHILTKYSEYGVQLLKPGGKLIIHGPDTLKKVLKKKLGFTSKKPWSSASPYYHDYESELTHETVHESWGFSDPEGAEIMKMNYFVK